MEKPATTQVPIHELIARRWSPVAFAADRPVTREQITALLEAARWAPSCYGDQPWRYLVWNRHVDASAWQRAFMCLAEGNQAWVRNAPVLLLAAASSRFTHNGKENRWGRYDTGAASENLCLQATAMGLQAHQMGGFDERAVRGAFSIPEDCECMAMIAVGHPADASVVEGELAQRQLAPRARASLSERFFDGEWGNGWQ
ncbi:MAG: nitroreductase family protein [Betaproteobacteria bacterium]|nr:nitroreductase family protein [Betaproteobacteria bacterium]